MNADVNRVDFISFTKAGFKIEVNFEDSAPELCESAKAKCKRGFKRGPVSSVQGPDEGSLEEKGLNFFKKNRDLNR